MSIRKRARWGGLTIVELIVTIAIVGTGVAGILLVLNVAVRGSADPLVEKQALAIAESLLEEIQLMPFTYCDPDDANAGTATNAAGCATQVENMGPEPGETRVSATTPFDNVNDYHGFTMTSITDITGTAIAGLSGYSASVAITQQALNGPPNVVAGESLLIAVTVNGPFNTTVRLDGYRTRYAPNLLP